MGLTLDGLFKAYPVSALKELKGPAMDSFAGQEILLHYEVESREAYITGRDGKQIDTVLTYWFVWESFHPGAPIYKLP